MRKNNETPGVEAPGTQSAAVCGKYVNLMNDVAFQWVFGRETNKDLLIALLNELLPDLHIEDLDYYKQRQISYAKDLKNSVFDVSCRLADGSYVDIEVQVCPQDWFADRCLYYSTYCIQEQIRTGQDNYKLKPVYIVSIDDFTLNHRPGWDGSILSSYSLREDRTHELMTDNLHFVFVELEHFDKSWETIDNDKERFYFCMRYLHELNSLPEGFAEGIWAKLAQQSEWAEMPSDLKDQYIKDMTTEIDKRAQLQYAERKGLEAGLEKGRAEGLEAGLEKGRAEKMEAAHRLKADGISADVISRCLGLSPEQVAAL